MQSNLTFNEFISLIRSYKAVTSINGIKYTLTTVNDKQISFRRESTKNEDFIDSRELYNFFNAVPSNSRTTSEAKKYISRLVQSPSVAILNAIDGNAKQKNPIKIGKTKLATRNKGRADSDEYYVIDLCNEILGYTAKQQYGFDFLLGDDGKTKLKVDAYYEELNLVIEYCESQHTEPTPFFDHNDKLTISGVTRGEQRKIYDQRRRDVLPQHGIKLIEIHYSDFGESKKINRVPACDKRIIKDIMKKEGII